MINGVDYAWVTGYTQTDRACAVPIPISSIVPLAPELPVKKTP